MSKLTDLLLADAYVGGGSGGGGGGGKFKSLIDRTIETVSENELRGIESIGDSAFSGCKQLQTITLPPTVKSIGSYAFSVCTSLTEISIPEGVNELKANLFAGCSRMQKVNLPSTVTSIASNVFSNMGDMKQIVLRAKTPPTIRSNTFSSFPYNCEILVPAESVESYKAAQYWSNRASYIKAIEE